MGIVDGLGEQEVTLNERQREPEAGLVDWVMARVNPWRDSRDQAFQQLWGEYYRLWRGRHTEADKSRKTERSKLVGPALAQALEMTVAEMEEATFGRDAWVALLGMPQQDDEGNMVFPPIPPGLQNTFLADLKYDKVPSAVADCYLNGALWGTLAAKVVVEKKVKRKIVPSVDPKSGRTERRLVEEPYVKVGAVAIPVDELIPDPDADCVDEMLGITHECTKSRSWLLDKEWGQAYAADRGASNPDALLTDTSRKDPEDLTITNPRDVLVTEWHGLVPLKLLERANGVVEGPPVEEDPLAAAIADFSYGDLDGDGRMVEAIVTILDKKHLALAIRNPYLMQDRAIVACQFERVPGKFWGRGVMEKGYNPQKALDAELRARMDALALITNPMVGVDQTALPRGFDMRVYPGKAWLTNGSPKEALMPFAFPGLDQASFMQTAEMERMVQMGTGAMDSATPIEGNRRNETLGGTSMIASTFVKRAKRALRHITADFTEPLIAKILARRQQYDFQRYPVPLDFQVVGTLGIVARELEQSQMTQLLSLVQPGSATQRLIVKAIFENSNSPYKAELEQAQAQDAAPNPQQQQLQELQMQAAQLELQNKQLENVKIATGLRETQAKTALIMAQVQTELQKPGEMNAKLQSEFARLQIELGELSEFSRQNDIATLKAVADVNKPQGGGASGKGTG